MSPSNEYFYIFNEIPSPLFTMLKKLRQLPEINFLSSYLVSFGKMKLKLRLSRKGFSLKYNTNFSFKKHRSLTVSNQSKRLLNTMRIHSSASQITVWSLQPETFSHRQAGGYSIVSVTFFIHLSSHTFLENSQGKTLKRLELKG